MSASNAKAGVNASAATKAANSANKTTTMQQSQRGIISEHSKDGPHHSWLFSPAMGAVLTGHGWADTSALLKLKHTKPSCIEGEQFPPYVKVQVKCYAVDLNIDNVQYLDKSNNDWLPFVIGTKLDLAKELIKEGLQKEGLLQTPKDEVDLNRENTVLVVADIIAVKELPNG